MGVIVGPEPSTKVSRVDEGRSKGERELNWGTGRKGTKGEGSPREVKCSEGSE